MAFNDNFTGTAGQKIIARSGWAMLGSGSTGDNPEINAAGTRMASAASNGDAGMVGQDVGSADHYVQVKLYTGFQWGESGNLPLLCVRTDSRNEGWGVLYRTSTSSWQIYKAGAGAGLRGSYAATFVDGDVIRLEAEGADIRFYLNGTLRISDPGVTDGLTQTGVGILVRNVASSVDIADDWESGALSATQTLTPSLLTNSQTFYSPTVTGGAAPQILAPGLLTNAQTFYGATVALPGVTAAYVLANTAPVGGNVAGAMYEVAGLVSPGDYMTYTTVSGPTPSGGTLVEYIDGSFDYTGGAPAIWVIQIKINGVDYFHRC